MTGSPVGACAEVSAGTASVAAVSQLSNFLLDFTGTSGSAADVTDNNRKSLSVTTTLPCTTGSSSAPKSCPIGDEENSSKGESFVADKLI